MRRWSLVVGGWLLAGALSGACSAEDSYDGANVGGGGADGESGRGGQSGSTAAAGSDAGGRSGAPGKGGNAGSGGTSVADAGAFANGGAGGDAGNGGVNSGGADAGTAGVSAGAGAGTAGARGEEECVVATDGVFDWDVATVTLTGMLTVNGGASSLGSAATFWLVDPETGDEALLGDMSRPTYTASVVPKTYDLVYRFTATTLPTTASAARHTNRRIRQSIEITASRTLDADLQTVNVTGRVTLDGRATTASGGTIWLASTTSTDEVLVHRLDGTGSFVAWVAPGTYDVYYRATPGHTLGAGPVANTNAKLASAVEVSAERTLDVDIPSIALSGRLDVTGAPSSSGGVVVLRRSGDDTAILGSAGSAYSARVVPGSYETYFSNATSEPSGRVNTNARLAGYQTLDTSRSDFDVEVPMLRSSSRVTLNGSVVPSTDSGNMVMLKRSGAGFLGPRDEATIARLQETSFPAAVYVVGGTYDLHLVNPRTGGFSGILGPVRNRDVRVGEALDLGVSASVDLDVPVVNLSGTTATAPASTGGYVVLRSRTQPGDFADLAVAGTGAYTAGVIPGRYDVTYEHRLVYDWEPDVPQVRNTRRVIRRDVDLTTPGAATLDVEVRARELTGAITLNGSILPSAYGGRLFLQSADGTDSAYIAAVTSPSYSAWVFPGTYDVYFDYTSGTTTGQVRNEHARLGCVVVPEPRQ